MTPLQQIERTLDEGLAKFEPDVATGLRSLCLKIYNMGVEDGAAEVAQQRERDAAIADEERDCAATDLHDARQELGKLYDHNSYGTGFDAGRKAAAEQIAEAIRTQIKRRPKGASRVRETINPMSDPKVLSELVAELERATGILSRLEWIEGNEGSFQWGFSWCPCCAAIKPIHEKDCELKALLRPHRRNA